VTDNVGDLIEDVAAEAERTRHRIRRRGFRPRRSGRGRPFDSPGEALHETTAGERAPRAEHPEVIGWQPLVLNRPQRCADCEEPIEPGERGFAGVGSAGLSDVYLCDDCMEARRASISR